MTGERTYTIRWPGRTAWVEHVPRERVLEELRAAHDAEGAGHQIVDDVTGRVVDRADFEGT